MYMHVCVRIREQNISLLPYERNNRFMISKKCIVNDIGFSHIVGLNMQCACVRERERETEDVVEHVHAT